VIWPLAIWLIITTACLTLAVVHAHVWFRNRRAVANAAFAVLVVSVAAMGYVELRMIRATTVAEYGRWIWHLQLPVWMALVAMVWFVRHYLHAGRPWLGWTAIALRTVALVVNALSSPGINFREIESIAPVTIFGEPFAVAQGVPNP
jgi:two-component system sensor kinase FixL